MARSILIEDKMEELLPNHRDRYGEKESQKSWWDQYIKKIEIEEKEELEEKEVLRNLLQQCIQNIKKEGWAWSKWEAISFVLLREWLGVSLYQIADETSFSWKELFLFELRAMTPTRYNVLEIYGALDGINSKNLYIMKEKKLVSRLINREIRCKRTNNDCESFISEQLKNLETGSIESRANAMLKIAASASSEIEKIIKSDPSIAGELIIWSQGK